MTRDEFWRLIEDARSDAESPEEVVESLERMLEQSGVPAVAAFLEQQTRLLESSYSWELWGAAYLLNGGCSDDGFDYFRGWLLTRGRQVFEAALSEPDSLADLVNEMDEAWCEEMIYLPNQVYHTLTGRYPEGVTINLPDLGPMWDFDDAEEMRNRYPRIWARFGWD